MYCMYRLIYHCWWIGICGKMFCVVTVCLLVSPCTLCHCSRSRGSCERNSRDQNRRRNDLKHRGSRFWTSPNQCVRRVWELEPSWWGLVMKEKHPSFLSWCCFLILVLLLFLEEAIQPDVVEADGSGMVSCVSCMPFFFFYVFFWRFEPRVLLEWSSGRGVPEQNT